MNKEKKVATRFHRVHGKNVLLNEDNTTAMRTMTYGDALVFSERPVEPGEIFAIEIMETDLRLSVCMKIGLTGIDPDTFNILPYAIPNIMLLDGTFVIAAKCFNNFWGSVDAALEATYYSFTGTYLSSIL